MPTTKTTSLILRTIASSHKPQWLNKRDASLRVTKKPERPPARRFRAGDIPEASLAGRRVTFALRRGLRAAHGSREWPNVTRQWPLHSGVRTEVARTVRQLGYAVARLDTDERLAVAARLYDSAGYRPIGNFNGNPIATFFGEKQLRTETHR